ncbi:MAG: hypothetical protein SCM96_13440 [Acidobacteriota bacterium]|nr:hypothetical protein [Acidobacteriota bacterium]
MHLKSIIQNICLMCEDKKSWRIVPGDVDIESLREDKPFAALLNLARSLNALRFCQFSFLAVTDHDIPSARRQRLNAFLFNCAILFEALVVVDGLGRFFRDYDAFTGFRDILRDHRFRWFRERILNRIRNKVVFQFDPEVASEVLTDDILKNSLFVESRGQKAGEAYFDLADSIAMKYILADPPLRENNENECMRKLCKDAIDLTGLLLDAGETLIADYLERSGWQLETTDQEMDSAGDED